MSVALAVTIGQYKLRYGQPWTIFKSSEGPWPYLLLDAVGADT